MLWFRLGGQLPLFLFQVAHAGLEGGVVFVVAPAERSQAVRQVPLPQAPAPGLQSSLVSTLNGLTAAGSFAGSKGSYIQGGVGRLEAITADRAYSNAVKQGVFPMSFAVADIDDLGDGTATANVTATAATGATAAQPLTFVAGPSPTGWQLSKGSAMALLSSVK